MTAALDLRSTNPGLYRRLKQAKAANIAMARISGAAFNEYVLRDEETGKPIVNAPVHYKWHDLIEKHNRLVLHSHIESAKTSSISIGRTLFELGRNRNLRICICSNTNAQAVKMVRTIAEYIKKSDRLREVFPDLLPGEPWTQAAITVQRDTNAKDPSVQATGVHGAVLGTRLDWLVLDDILDYENTRTHSQRQELARWFRATLMGRMTAQSRILAVGTAWSPEDLYHELAKNPTFKHAKFGVLDCYGNPTWPARWPLSRIHQVREALGPIEAARQLDCVPSDESTTRFKQEWIDRALELGNGLQPLKTVHGVRIAEGAFCVTGVDLAAGKKQRGGSAGAVTAFFTLLIHPDGTREVINIESGNFTAPEIAQLIIDHHVRYQSTIFVESNGVQSFIVDMVRDRTAVPVQPFHTGSNKWHPQFGVESIATEMAAGKWIIPNENGNTDPQIAAWIAEMKQYDPAQHTGDLLMACWFAREGARQFQNGATAEVGVRIFAPEED